MGIRFRCHHCETELHVKDFQAGKRGRCPECQGKFRIPASDAPHSLAPDANVDNEPIALERASDEVIQSAPTADAGPSQTPIESPSQQLDQVKQEPAPQTTEPAAIPPPPQSTLPQALQSAIESKWYVRPPSGGQFGPAHSPVMWQWLGENRVGRDALVWCEGWPEWLIAENVFSDYFSSVENDSLSPSATASSAPGSPVSTATTARTPPAAAALAGQAPYSSSGPVSERSADATATPTPILSDRNRAGRKQKRRRNYTMMIAVLTVVMLLLIGSLIVVLMRQTS